MEKEEKIMPYLAGVMDGDGSFSIGKLLPKGNPLYFPSLQCSSWRTFVFLLKETFGGNIVVSPKHICKDGSEGKALFRWKLRSHKNVIPVLEKIIPYLKIKKERAEFLFSFIQENPFERGVVLSKEIIKRRESAYLKMIQLNDWKNVTQKISKNLARSISPDWVFWSYLAGLFDTDGSFSVKKQILNKGTDVKNARYTAFIQLSMTDTRAINYLRENCPFGRLWIPKNKGTNAGFHFQYSIYKREECIVFLEKIIPYLYSKKENALVLLEFCKKITNTRYCKAGISENELIFRDQCYKKLCSLNKYGVYKPTLIDLEAREGDRAEGASHGERLSERDWVT